MAKQIKSKQRVAERGEVFTADREVQAMCDLVNYNHWGINCGLYWIGNLFDWQRKSKKERAAMFDIFRKKRIDHFTEGANRYVTRIYKDPSARHSTSKTDSGIMYSDRGGGHCDPDEAANIPSRGDMFRKDTVGQLFALYAANHASFNRHLDSALNLTFVDSI